VLTSAHFLRPALEIEFDFHQARDAMYVCVCRAVTDKEVEGALERGACTIDQVGVACGAGGDCGACRGRIAEMIEERRCSARALPVLRDRAA
jgi:bacterioferritin-associated ferredoxin